jgi:hypothetical protein
VNAASFKVYPPDGEGKIWWARLKKALGTNSSDFVNASLLHLQKGKSVKIRLCPAGLFLKFG